MESHTVAHEARGHRIRAVASFCFTPDKTMAYTIRMNWALRRQQIIAAILIAAAALILSAVVIATTYKAPSCMDNKQNQGEEGVDCGGPCPYLCTVSESEPSVRFVHAVSPEAGRTDVIAYIDNSNMNGEAQHAKYTVELYDSNGTAVASKTGTVTLPQNTTAPIFIPAAYLGSNQITQAFLTIDPSSLRWIRTSSAKPTWPATSAIQIQNGAAPRVTATLTNPTAHDMYNVTVVATVFDASDNAIGASQTIVPILPGQGTAPLIFTWNQAFAGTPVRAEILPATGS